MERRPREGRAWRDRLQAGPPGLLPPGAGEGPGAIPRHRPQEGPGAAPGLGPPAVRGHLCGLRPLCVAAGCGSHRTLIRCPPRPISHPAAAPGQPCPPPPTHPRPLSLAKCFGSQPSGHSPARHGSLHRSLLAGTGRVASGSDEAARPTATGQSRGFRSQRCEPQRCLLLAVWPQASSVPSLGLPSLLCSGGLGAARMGRRRN